jgi:hypothetical protein
VTRSPRVLGLVVHVDSCRLKAVVKSKETINNLYLMSVFLMHSSKTRGLYNCLTRISIHFCLLRSPKHSC